MPFVIRKYQDADLEPVTRLWRLAREVSLPDFQREKGYPFDKDQWYFNTHILPENQLYVAEQYDRAVGFLAIKDDFVDCLYIHPDFWRMGIGKALLDFAKQLSPQRVWLYTLQINVNARAFYENNGFKAVRFGVSLPPENEPDVMYEWTPQANTVK